MNEDRSACVVYPVQMNVHKKQKPTPQLSENRYAARMLFQYRYANDSKGSMRTVEERIVLLFAQSASAAYSFAKEKGETYEHKFKNDDGLTVHFEFVGLTDLMHLGVEVESDEVWYDIRRMKDPMQRKKKLIPRRASLSAFRHE